MQKIVTILAEDRPVIQQIADAVSQHAPDVKIWGFTTKRTFLLALERKKSSKQHRKGWVPLVFVCTDQQQSTSASLATQKWLYRYKLKTVKPSI